MFDVVMHKYAHPIEDKEFMFYEKYEKIQNWEWLQLGHYIMMGVDDQKHLKF